MTLFFDVLAMYLLIFPDSAGCASSSINVQIHDGANSVPSACSNDERHCMKVTVFKKSGKPGTFRLSVFIMFPAKKHAYPQSLPFFVRITNLF